MGQQIDCRPNLTFTIKKLISPLPVKTPDIKVLIILFFYPGDAVPPDVAYSSHPDACYQVMSVG